MIESTGQVQSLADAIAMVRPGGTIVLFGIYTASEGALPFYQLYYKEPTIVSARAATSEDFPESIDLVASGRVKLSPLVTQVLPLSQLRRCAGHARRRRRRPHEDNSGALRDTDLMTSDTLSCSNSVWQPQRPWNRPEIRRRSRRAGRGRPGSP